MPAKRCVGALRKRPDLLGPALMLSLLLHGCGEEAAAPPKEAQPRTKPAAVQPKQEQPKGTAEALPSKGGEDAAEVVQAYYSHIEARDYAKAYALREPAPDAPSATDFATNFERYAEH